MHDTLAKTPIKNEGTYDVSLHLPWDFEDSGLLNSSSVLGSENIQKQTKIPGDLTSLPQGQSQGSHGLVFWSIFSSIRVLTRLPNKPFPMIYQRS